MKQVSYSVENRSEDWGDRNKGNNLLIGLGWDEEVDINFEFSLLSFVRCAYIDI
jgi:hypothetical protein